MMLSTKLVTFDATGTLLQFRTPVMNQYIAAAAKFGITAEPTVIKENFKTHYRRMCEEHPVFGKTTGLGWENWWDCIVRATFDDYVKNREDEAKVAKISEYLMDSFQTTDAWICTDDVRVLLQRLKSYKIELGVISNFDPRLHTILRALNLDKYFSFILTSYEVGFEKPDVRIFMEALSSAGLDNGEGACHVGDNALLDYHGARSCGFDAFLLKTVSEPSPNVHPSHVLPHLSSIIKHIHTDRLISR